MTEQEKARELLDRFLEEPTLFDPLDYDDAKQCALICVDEQMKLINDYAERQMLTNWANALGYWEQVKKEINKL